MCFASFITEFTAGRVLVFLFSSVALLLSLRGCSTKTVIGPGATIFAAAATTLKEFLDVLNPSSSPSSANAGTPSTTSVPQPVASPQVIVVAQPSAKTTRPYAQTQVQPPKSATRRKDEVKHARIVSQNEYQQERARDTIPGDGRIWKAQSASCTLREHAGVAVEFFAFRVLLEDSSGNLFARRSYHIDPVKLGAGESCYIQIPYPQSLLDLCNENWKNADKMVHIKFMHTLLVGKDANGDEVLVDIETGDTRSHPPKKFVADHFFY